MLKMDMEYTAFLMDGLLEVFQNEWQSYVYSGFYAIITKKLTGSPSRRPANRLYLQTVFLIVKAALMQINDGFDPLEQ